MSRQLASALASAALLLLFAHVSEAADHAREKKWADEITPGIVVGDPVCLTSESGVRFLAIHTAVPNARTVVILAHGLGVHPDWGVIGALRVRLADLGYATLSLQMPVLPADAKADQYPATFPEAAERFDAGVAFRMRRCVTKRSSWQRTAWARAWPITGWSDAIPQIFRRGRASASVTACSRIPRGSRCPFSR